MASAALTTCARFVLDENVWYILGEWYKGHFSIRVTDGARAWEGEVSADEVDKRATRWDWTPKQYVEAAVEHLREQQEGIKASYQLTERDANTLQLAWEMKQAGEEGVPLRGFVNLPKTDDPGGVVCAMMDYMHQKRQDLEMELSRKTRAFRGMKEEAEKSANQARTFAEEKTQLESDLYTKFAAVLNSKKAKIRELKSQLVEGRSLAIVPGNEESDQGEATENEESGGEEDHSNDEETEGGGANGRSASPMEEELGRREGGNADWGVEGREESAPSASGREEKRGVKEESGEDEKRPGRGAENDIGGEEERKGDAKPQAGGASALLGGGSTYTSGPRKRRR